MTCACCGAELARARDLPETRGWLRAGDRVCINCGWVYPRELIWEAELIVTRCRLHADGDDAAPSRPTP